jgi:hypothetical protein
MIALSNNRTMVASTGRRKGEPSEEKTRGIKCRGRSNTLPRGHLQISVRGLHPWEIDARQSMIDCCPHLTERARTLEDITPGALA